MKRRADEHRSETMPAMPSGTPRWISAELIAKTIRTWQPYYDEPLTPEDAVAMITGVGRLVDVLIRGKD